MSARRCDDPLSQLDGGLYATHFFIVDQDMKRVKRTIDVGDWTMDVHAESRRLDGRWVVEVSDIRSLDRTLPDWRDDQQSYDSAELAVAAARRWAEQALGVAGQGIHLAVVSWPGGQPG